MLFAFYVSARVDTFLRSLGSLKDNQLCGLDEQGGDGTYAAEGITKICEALKGSAVTSLKCATALECSRFCRRP